MAFIAAARPFCVERTRAPALPPAAASGLPPAATPPPGAAAVAAGAATAACPLSAGGRSSTLERSGPAPPVSPRICSAAKCSLLCSGGSVAPLRRWVRARLSPAQPQVALQRARARAARAARAAERRTEQSAESSPQVASCARPGTRAAPPGRPGRGRCEQQQPQHEQADQRARGHLQLLGPPLRR
eukprot:scaffold40349_cov79-Phaeocystis_antarctica.AAC.1